MFRGDFGMQVWDFSMVLLGLRSMPNTVLSRRVGLILYSATWVSAARVLVTTRCIFLQPHEIGLTGHLVLLPISLWVAITMEPVWELGLLFDANEASEKARNLRSAVAIGWILMVTSWCFLASWRAWFAVMRVSIVARLMADWRILNLLDKSGLVWTDAYCRLPMRALNCCLSSSVTGDSLCFLRFLWNFDGFNGSNVFGLWQVNCSFRGLLHFNTGEGELTYPFCPERILLLQ